MVEVSMHSCELITNLRAKKVLCHRVEVVKNFRCCNHRLCFLQRDWHEQNCSSKPRNRLKVSLVTSRIYLRKVRLVTLGSILGLFYLRRSYLNVPIKL